MADRELPISTAARKTLGARPAPPTLISTQRRGPAAATGSGGWMRAGEWLLFLCQHGHGRHLHARGTGSVEWGWAGRWSRSQRRGTCRGRCRFRYRAAGRRGRRSQTGHAHHRYTEHSHHARYHRTERRCLQSQLCPFHFRRANRARRADAISPRRRCQRHQIDLAWTDDATNETGFEIERSPDGTYVRADGDGGANVTWFPEHGADGDDDLSLPSAHNEEVGDRRGRTRRTRRRSAPDRRRRAISSRWRCQRTQIDLAWTDNATNNRVRDRAVARWDDVRADRDGRGERNGSYQNTGLTATTTYHYRCARPMWSVDRRSRTRRTRRQPSPSPHRQEISPRRPYPAARSIWRRSTTRRTKPDSRSNGHSDGATFTPLTTVGANVTTYANTGLAIRNNVLLPHLGHQIRPDRPRGRTSRTPDGERSGTIAMEFDGDRRIEQPE